MRVVAIIRKESKSDQLKTPKRGNPAGYVPFICGDHWLYWLKRSAVYSHVMHIPLVIIPRETSCFARSRDEIISL